MPGAAENGVGVFMGDDFEPIAGDNAAYVEDDRDWINMNVAKSIDVIARMDWGGEDLGADTVLGMETVLAGEEVVIEGLVEPIDISGNPRIGMARCGRVKVYHAGFQFVALDALEVGLGSCRERHAWQCSKPQTIRTAPESKS
jgi:hypothetical protein